MSMSSAISTRQPSRDRVLPPLSSTTSARSPFGRAFPCSELTLRSEAVSVTVTVNVVPLFFSLSTWISPFIMSTMFFVIAMPRPVLPYWLEVPLNSCEKASNSFGRYSLLMPMPVSFMMKRSVQ